MGKETETEYKIRMVITGRYNWVPEKSPVLLYSANGTSIKLPEQSAHIDFTGNYQRPVAFPLLRMFHEREIDSLIKAELSQLNPETLVYWTEWKKDEKNQRSFIYFRSDSYWETIHTGIFVDEAEFNADSIFQAGIKKYGVNHFRHNPGYVALHVYADPQQLLDAYGDRGISVWSIEKRDQWNRRSEALRNALFHQDVGGISAFFKESLQSGELPIDCPSEKVDDLALEMAASIVLALDDESDKIKPNKA